MDHIPKLAIMKWWATLSPSRKLATWQAAILFIAFNTILTMAVAYNNLRIEKNNEILIWKAKTDQVNESWILYLQESIEKDRQLYEKSRIIDEKINKIQHENTTIN